MSEEADYKPRLGDRVFYRHKDRKNKIYPALIAEIDLQGNIFLVYFGKINGHAEGVDKAVQGKDPGQWWPSLDELEVTTEFDIAFPSRRRT